MKIKRQIKRTNANKMVERALRFYHHHATYSVVSQGFTRQLMRRISSGRTYTNRNNLLANLRYISAHPKQGLKNLSNRFSHKSIAKFMDKMVDEHRKNLFINQSVRQRKHAVRKLKRDMAKYDMDTFYMYNLYFPDNEHGRVELQQYIQEEAKRRNVSADVIEKEISYQDMFRFDGLFIRFPLGKDMVCSCDVNNITSDILDDLGHNEIFDVNSDEHLSKEQMVQRCMPRIAVKQYDTGTHISMTIPTTETLDLDEVRRIVQVFQEKGFDWLKDKHGNHEAPIDYPYTKLEMEDNPSTVYRGEQFFIACFGKEVYKKYTSTETLKTVVSEVEKQQHEKQVKYEKDERVHKLKIFTNNPFNENLVITLRDELDFVGGKGYAKIMLDIHACANLSERNTIDTVDKVKQLKSKFNAHKRTIKDEPALYKNISKSLNRIQKQHDTFDSVTGHDLLMVALCETVLSIKQRERFIQWVSGILDKIDMNEFDSLAKEMQEHKTKPADEFVS